jgi:hypothetical protein
VVGERRHRQRRRVAGLLVDPAQHPVIQLHHAADDRDRTRSN